MKNVVMPVMYEHMPDVIANTIAQAPHLHGAN